MIILETSGEKLKNMLKSLLGVKKAFLLLFILFHYVMFELLILFIV